MRRLKSEDQILDLRTRALIIEEIEGSENKRRKDKAYQRYQCYKDKTIRYVAEHLLSQFDLDTVIEMRYCLSNISIVKKVIDKLARVYSSGVEREIEGNETETEKLKELDKQLKLTQNLKKTNKFLKLQRNIMFYLKPCPSLKEPGKWSIVPQPLQPYLYDVIENYYDRTQPLCLILSDYQPRADILTKLEVDGSRSTSPSIVPESDKKDQLIADAPVDSYNGADANDYYPRKRYIWWTEKYHFTTDDHGEILPNDEGLKTTSNDLGTAPYQNFAVDQDGSFWAEGGDDLIDGAVLLNALITHNEHVGVVQGYGQFYMTGKNLPRQIKVGPTKAIIAEYDKDESPEPKMGFLSANPQLDSLRANIEMYIALLLTTNNLSTSGVASTLNGSKDFASGVALVIDKSESVEDVQDQRQVFLDNEPLIFKKINQIIEALGDSAESELKENKLSEQALEDFGIRFNDSQVIMSEKEKLEVMKMRQELGIDSLIDALKRDDPSLDDVAAEAKLKKLLEERIKQQVLVQQLQKDAGLDDPNDFEGDDEEEEKENPKGKVDDSQKDDDDGNGNVGDN